MASISGGASLAARGASLAAGVVAAVALTLAAGVARSMVTRGGSF